jgi:short-subunit dehydrogenase
MGRSVSTQLAAKGANIVIVARNVEKLQTALENIKVLRMLQPHTGSGWLTDFCFV